MNGWTDHLKLCVFPELGLPRESLTKIILCLMTCPDEQHLQVAFIASIALQPMSINEAFLAIFVLIGYPLLT